MSGSEAVSHTTQSHTAVSPTTVSPTTQSPTAVSHTTQSHTAVSPTTVSPTTVSLTAKSPKPKSPTSAPKTTIHKGKTTRFKSAAWAMVALNRLKSKAAAAAPANAKLLDECYWEWMEATPFFTKSGFAATHYDFYKRAKQDQAWWAKRRAEGKADE
jgi:hypothetical protein